MTELMTTDHPATATRATNLDGLVDLLDQLLSTGASINGDVLICVAGVELIQLDLRALLRAVSGNLSGDVSGEVSA